MEEEDLQAVFLMKRKFSDGCRGWVVWRRGARKFFLVLL